jgi:hypothetical protein
VDKSPLHNFTLPARAVIVSGLFLAAGGTWAYIEWSYDSLPQGSYPLFFFAMPVLLVAGVVVGLGLLALRLLGIPIYRGLPPHQDRPSGEGPPP